MTRVRIETECGHHHYEDAHSDNPNIIEGLRRTVERGTDWCFRCHKLGERAPDGSGIPYRKVSDRSLARITAALDSPEPEPRPPVWGDNVTPFRVRDDD